MTGERVTPPEDDPAAPHGAGVRSPDPYAGTAAPESAPPEADDVPAAGAPAPGAAPDAVAGRRKGRKRHAATRLVGGLFAAIAILIVLVIGGAAMKLRSGPVDISRLAPMLSEQLSAQFPGGSVEVEGATLSLVEGSSGALRFGLQGFTLFDEAGSSLAQAPNISGLFLTSDLARGNFKPNELVISDVRVAVRRLEDGRLVIAAVSDEDDGYLDSAALVALLQAQGSVDGDESAVQPEKAEPGLETVEDAEKGDTIPDAAELADAASGGRLSLENVELIYVDEITGREWQAQDVTVAFATTRFGVRGTAEIDVDGGQFGRQTLRVQGFRASSGALYLDGEFSNIAVADLASQITALEWLAPFEAPVAGRLKLSLDDAGEVTAMSGSLSAGSGLFRTPGMTGRGAVTSILTAGIDFVYEPLSERFTVSSVRMDAERGRFEGEGLIELERNADEVLTGLVAQVTLHDVNASVPEIFAAPLVYDRADMTARLRLDPMKVEIGDLTLSRGDLGLGAAGVIRRGDEGAIAADLILRGNDLTAADLLAHWPPEAAGNARDWVEENIIGGDIKDVNASVRFGGARDVLSLDFTFANIESRYLDDMPPVRGGAGAGQLDLTAFHLSLTDGEVAVPEPVPPGDEPSGEIIGGAPLNLAGSSLSIVGLDQPLEQMKVDLRGSGPAKAMIAIIDMPPLSLISKLGAPIDVTAGAGEVRAAISFPLLKDLLVEDITADATAALRDIEGVVGPEEFAVRAPSIDIEASAERMALTMNGAVEGVALDAVWREDFVSGARSVQASGAVTPRILSRFGVDQPWFTDGAINANVKAATAAGGYAVDVDADITRAALNVREAGWRKAIGEDGRIRTSVRTSANAITLTGLSAYAGGYEIAGDVRVTPDGAPLALTLSRAKIPGILDGAVSLERDGAAWNASITGAFLDVPALRKRLAELDDDEAPAQTEPADDAADGLFGGVEVNALIDLARVQLTSDIYIAAARGGAALGDAMRVDLSGDVGGVAPVQLIVEPSGGDHALTLTSDNAGRLMRALGVFDDGAGGVLDITATLPAGDPEAADGVLSVRDLVVHDDAKLDRLLIDGEQEALRAKMRAEGLYFKKIIAPFRWRGDALAVKDAYARGGDIGVTIDGVYYLDEERLDMKGVFTPFYGVNSALGGIPLLGKVLTGGDREGIFALNYTVTGAASDPDVDVNPLSLLAPGILRKLIDGDGDGEGPSPPVNEYR